MAQLSGKAQMSGVGQQQQKPQMGGNRGQQQQQQMGGRRQQQQQLGGRGMSMEAVEKLHDRLMGDVRKGGVNLKHVNTCDKSKPMIDKNYHLKKAAKREPLLNEIKKGHELKHVRTCDKGKPLIEKDIHIKKMDRGSFLSEVREGVELKPISQA